MFAGTSFFFFLQDGFIDPNNQCNICKVSPKTADRWSLNPVKCQDNNFCVSGSSRLMFCYVRCVFLNAVVAMGSR